MATINAAREAILLRWETEWASAGQTEPFTYENEKYNPPAGPWLFLSIDENLGGQETLGPTGVRRFRRGGMINVEVRDLIGKGSKAIEDLAQAVKAIFEAVSFSGIDTTNTTLVKIPADGRYYGMLVATRFDYDEIK